MIYLDNAATTVHKPRAVAERMAWSVNNLGSPGRGGHRFAMDAAERAFACRERAAKLFNVCDPENVVFTFNATHGLNIAVNSLVKPGMRVVISGYEHNSVLRPLAAAGAEIEVAEAPVFNEELILRAFEEKLKEKTDAVFVNHVSNVFGNILPIEEIARLCRERDIPLVVDASQSAGSIEMDMEKSGAAFIAMPGHKGLYGPQGTGLLLCAHDTKPLLVGGSGSNSVSPGMPDFLPDRLEAGTHNMPGIYGLDAGLEFVMKKGSKEILKYEQSLISLAKNGLGTIKGVELFAADDPKKQAGVMSFTVQGISAEQMGEALSARGIAVRAGLHCAPLAHKTVGTFPNGTVRLSVSAFNRKNDIYHFVEQTEKILYSFQKNGQLNRKY